MSKLVTSEAITVQSAEACNVGCLALPEQPWHQRSRRWALQCGCAAHRTGVGDTGDGALGWGGGLAAGPAAVAVNAGLVPDQEPCWNSRGRS